MRILADDIHAIRETLLEQLAKGNEIVAYNEELVYASKRDLVFFADKESFDKYAKLHNSDHALFFEWNTKQVLNCVEAVFQHKIDFDKSESFSYSDGIYTFHDPLNIANADTLKNQLKALGFEERICQAIGPAVDLYRGLGYGSFHLLQRERSESEKHMYDVHFVQEPNGLSYRLAGYEATLRIAPDIPDVTINDIRAKELDRAMKSIDWSIDHHRDSLVEEYIKTTDGNDFLDRLDAIIRDVSRLYKSNEEGRDAAECLMYKHWYGEPWEPTEMSLEHIRHLYEWKYDVDLLVHPQQTIAQTYDTLNTNARECLALVEGNNDLLQTYLHKSCPTPEMKREEAIALSSGSIAELMPQLLQRALHKIGFDEAPHLDLGTYLANQYDTFDISVSKEVASEKVKFQLHFEQAGSDWYLFKHYDATLYHQIPVEHIIINGVDTKLVEEKMKQADWYFEYAESNYDWEKGFTKVREINDALNTLCKDEKGRIIATQLWNNHVPLFTVSKPELIRKCEEENHLYYSMRFAAEIPVNTAHKELKNVVLKNELHHHEQHSLAKEQTPVVQAQKDNEKPRHSHRPKIN